jgi:hypothetical protein
LAAPGRRVEWLVLDELEQCTVASCATNSKARKVRDALNNFLNVEEEAS